MLNRKKIRGIKIYIDNDVTVKKREKFKRYRNRAQIERENGKFTRMAYEKLNIERRRKSGYDENRSGNK